jgi:hypothetical protein
MNLDTGADVPGIRAKIERFTDDSNPGWVECSFVDAAGVVQIFDQKVPWVTAENLDARSTYPRDGIINIDCIISTHRGADGREVLSVYLDCGSRSGQTEFEVFLEQVA